MKKEESKEKNSKRFSKISSGSRKSVIPYSSRRSSNKKSESSPFDTNSKASSDIDSNKLINSTSPFNKTSTITPSIFSKTKNRRDTST